MTRDQINTFIDEFNVASNSLLMLDKAFNIDCNNSSIVSNMPELVSKTSGYKHGMPTNTIQRGTRLIHVSLPEITQEELLAKFGA